MGEPEAESDLRRRAAWLLLMLAVVAVLFIVVISAVAGSDSGGGSAHDTPGALDSAANSAGISPSGTPHRKSHTSSHAAGRSQSDTSKPPVGTTSCPTSQTCILESDIGHGVQAINDYRTAHGKPAVPGSVGAKAQDCAVHNGNGCSGAWAETELSTPDGQEAVQKILPFAHLLDKMTSVEVGWAYDPKAKLYYFAIIRKG